MSKKKMWWRDCERAISFMKNRSLNDNSSSDEVHQKSDSFLVKWLKEISAANQLELCLLVIEEGCRDPHSGFLRDEMEAIDCLLGCIYSSSAIDKWSTMASLLWTLQQFEGSDHFQRLELQIRSAEFHIEAGRLLALYQVSNLALLYMQILFLRFLFQLICAFYVPTHHGFTISSLDTDFCYHSFLVG
ncbi:hypothetical protein Droror1_Dr00010313 [Drosera rotundifolia]